MFRLKITCLVAAVLIAGLPAIAVGDEAGGFGGAEVWVAYLGEFGTHPGIAAGARFLLFDGERYELSAGPVIGLYVHPRNHIGLFVDGEIENRLVLPSGLFFTLGAGAGYYHTRLAGDGVYSRASDGSIARTFDWGRPHLKAGGSLGLGWDFAQTAAAPLEIFSRVDIFAQYPFNNAVLPHAAILAGAAYGFGGTR